MRTLLLLPWLACVSGLCGSARAATILSAAPALKIAPAPQSAGLAEAGFGMSLGLAGFWTNPASPATTRSAQEVSIAHNAWGYDVSQETFSAAAKAAVGTVAFAASLFQTGVQERRTAQGFVSGETRAVFYAFHGGWSGRPMPGLWLGAAVRSLIEKLDATTITSVALDLGGIWRTPLDGLSLGLSGADLGVALSAPDTSRYRLPMRGLAGLAYRIPKQDADLGAGIEFQGVDKIATIRAGGRWGWQFGALGAEIRAGWRGALKTGWPSGPAGGLSLSWNDVSLHYAYVAYPEVQAHTHRVAVDYRRAPTAGEMRRGGAPREDDPVLETPLPPAPERLYGLPGLGSLKLVWDPPRTRDRILGYNIYLVDAATKQARKLNSAPINATSAPFPKAPAGIAVVLSVAAVYAPAGPSATPVEGRRAGPLRVVPRKAGDLPHAPQRLVGASTGGKISLAWLPNEGGDAAGYHVYAASSEGSTPQRLTRRPAPKPSYVDPDVAAGTPVYYHVTAVDARGREGSASERIRVTP